MGYILDFACGLTSPVHQAIVLLEVRKWACTWFVLWASWPASLGYELFLELSVVVAGLAWWACIGKQTLHRLLRQMIFRPNAHMGLIWVLIFDSLNFFSDSVQLISVTMWAAINVGPQNTAFVI